MSSAAGHPANGSSPPDTMRHFAVRGPAPKLSCSPLMKNSALPRANFARRVFRLMPTRPPSLVHSRPPQSRRLLTHPLDSPTPPAKPSCAPQLHIGAELS